MENIKFTYFLTENVLQGDLIYRNTEYSIDFIDYSHDKLAVSIGNNGCFSLTVDTLQLEVSIETKQILYPWGYFPMAKYTTHKINKTKFLRGNIYVDIHEANLLRGTAYEIPKSNLWKIFKDVDNGWIYIGSDKTFNNDSEVLYIEFAKNSIIGIKDNNVVALLIKPLIHNG
jgi:hypothetical protein